MKNQSYNYFNFLRKSNINNLLQVLILSILPALIIGPLIAELILLLCIVLFFILVNHNKANNKFIIIDKFIYFFIFFYGYFLVNSLFSDTPSTISIKIFFFFRFILLLIIINYTFHINENFLNNLLKTILITFVVLFIDALIQKVFSYNLLGQKIINPYRVSSFFGDELIMGGYISRICPLIILGVFIFKNHYLKKFSLFIYIVSFYFVLISGERSSVVNYVISLIYFLFFLDISKILKLKILLVIIVMSTFFISFDSKIKTRIVKHYTEQTSNNKFFDNKILKLIPVQLIEINKESLEMFEKNKLFGQGPYAFRYYCENKVQDKVCKGGHPHNSYLQLLTETGLVGTLYFLIPLFFLLILQIKLRLKKNSDKKNYNLITIFSCTVFLILWPINQHGNIFNNWLNISYFFLFSTYIHFLRKEI